MQPSFVTRFFLAFATFFKVLFDAAFAGRVLALRQAAETDTQAPALDARKSAPPARTASAPTDHGPAVSLLGVLQREGRLVDFLLEDISAFSDGDVAAAARIVHGSCRKSLLEYVTIEPVRTEAEGAAIIVERGFDPGAIRLTGNVTGEPPFRGALRHHGWRVREVRLPAPSSADGRVITPAEVEL